MQKKHKIRNQNQTGINIEACRPSPKHQVVLQGSVPLSKGIPEQAQHYHIEKYSKVLSKGITELSYRGVHSIPWVFKGSIPDICHF